VIGFDDSDVAAALDLTTVRQRFEETGRLAARALVEQMQATGVPRRRVVLSLDLVVRGTA
jgi:LacI family transcriptional regulator